MKNRKNVLIVFAILAILCLGIGYAGLTDVLTLNGTINVKEVTFENEKEFDLVWVSGTATPTASSDSPAGRAELTANAVASSANDVATLTVDNMSIMGDKVEATFTFKNLEMTAPKETYTAYVMVYDATGTAINNDLFDIVFTGAPATADLEANETASIGIVITLKKSVVDASETYTFAISVEANTTSN